VGLAPLAEPPGDFALELPIVALSGPWYRVHATAYGPVFFNRTDTYRFNAPSGEFGVLYCAEAVETAFAETFLRFGKRPPVVLLSRLEACTVSELGWGTPRRVVDLSGMGALRSRSMPARAAPTTTRFVSAGLVGSTPMLPAWTAFSTGRERRPMADVLRCLIALVRHRLRDSSFRPSLRANSRQPLERSWSAVRRFSSKGAYPWGAPPHLKSRGWV
jgi:hypothetical protein